MIPIGEGGKEKGRGICKHQRFPLSGDPIGTVGRIRKLLMLAICFKEKGYTIVMLTLTSDHNIVKT